MAEKLTITITPTFSGYIVAADAVASRNDPLAQSAAIEGFPTLDEAVDALPRIARLEIARFGVGAPK